MQTVRAFLGERPLCPIYHYTDAAATIGILQDKQIWASNIRHLNDSSEYIRARDLIAKELERSKGGRASRALAELTNSTPEARLWGRSTFELLKEHHLAFVASFSEAENLLSQWRAYCPKGNGYSLGFDSSKFVNSKSGMTLVKCAYSRQEVHERCMALIDSWEEEEIEGDSTEAKQLNLMHDCVVMMSSVKDESFKEEQEWRLVTMSSPVFYRPGRHGIVPYCKVPIGGEGELQLKNIWIGPNTDGDAAKSAIQRLVFGAKVGDVTFHDSSTPYRP